MISISTITGFIKKGSYNLLKVTRFGRADHQEAYICAPFGLDSIAPKDVKAVHAKTLNDGKPVIIGVLNKEIKADTGETRLYAVDASGAEIIDILLKKDGTAEINGTGEFLVKWTAMNTAQQATIGLINAELGKISGFFAGLGITYTVAPITLDLSGAKAGTLKCGVTS